jgi:hypothetical protein
MSLPQVTGPAPHAVFDDYTTSQAHEACDAALDGAPGPDGYGAKYEDMFVMKRDGTCQPVRPAEVIERLRSLCLDIEPQLDLDRVSVDLVGESVIRGIYPGVSTADLDKLAQETSAMLMQHDPQYDDLAARIAISDLHKRVPASFTAVARRLRDHCNPQTGRPSPMLDDETWAFIERHAAALEAAIVPERDYSYNYFGIMTLCKTYLMLDEHKSPIERPQHMLMRVAVGVLGKGVYRGSFGPVQPAPADQQPLLSVASDEQHERALAAVLDTYDLLSRHLFTHATPTLFNAGSRQPQLSSCYLLQETDDSIDGMYETLKRCALISKSGGGIGVAVHRIRAQGSYVNTTNGTSGGIVPMLRVYNETARHVDQGTVSCRPAHLVSGGQGASQMYFFFFTSVCAPLCTQAAASARAPLPSTWSRGMPMSRPFSSCASTMARRSCARATSSSASGCLTCLCGAWSRAPSGRSFALMRRPASTSAGVPSLTLSTSATRARAVHAAPSRRRTFGSRSSSPKSRQARPTCSSKMLATKRAINSIWAPSNAPICT